MIGFVFYLAGCCVVVLGNGGERLRGLGIRVG